MRNLLTLLLVGLFLPSAFTQDYKKEEAKAYFVHQHYTDALSVLKSAQNLVRNDEEARFLMAVCHYQLNELEAADAIFADIMEESRSPYPECWLYRGKIAHATHQFQKAATYYKGYLRRLKPSHGNRAMVWDAIRRCATGMRLQYRRLGVAVENLGTAVNSQGDEFAPVISPNFNDKLYFSAIRPGNNGGMRDEDGLPDSRFGHFYSDMFHSRSTAGGGSWKPAEPMHYLLNSPRHDVLLDFSSDGTVLYYFRGWQPEKGQIYVDTFRRVEKRKLSSDPFSGPVVSSLGDGTPYLVGDTLVLFASRRPGGYGGLDLYRTALRNGSWTAPENMGPQINSAYDETTPFLARDGMTLYYSTNHPRLSIGGLDIVKVVFNPNSQKWTLPELLPPPLNSAGDDAYFRVNKDGFTAYFSSSRKDGYGKRDIYAAYFSEFLPEMELPVLYSSANVPDQPTRIVQPDMSQPASDRASEPRSDEQETEPVEEVVEEPVELTAAPCFAPLSFDADNTSLQAAHENTLQETVATLKEHSGLGVVFSAYGTYEESVGQQLFAIVKYAEYAARYLVENGISEDRIFLRSGLSAGQQQPQVDISFFSEEKVAEGLPVVDQGAPGLALPEHTLNKKLLYKVQVGALKGPYNSSRINKYDSPMVETMIDFPYYRYTLGAFETFQEAEKFRKELLDGPFDSAMLVAYIYGRRVNHKQAQKYLEEFADLKHYVN